MASKPRGWTGARTPSAIKATRVAARREAINKPRRSAAKTFVATALRVATHQIEGDPAVALAEAYSALDKAAKVGTIHPNAAARRKARLAVKVNAAVGGAHVVTTAKSIKTTGTAAAAKAAKARIAAGKAAKAKGAQTAAGKAKAALSKTARTESAPVAVTTAIAEAPMKAAKPAAKPASRPTKPKATETKATETKATETKATAKPAAAKAPAKPKKAAKES